MYKRFGLSDLHPLHMIHRLWYQPPCSTLQTKSATRFGFAAILVNDCFESQNFWYISNFFWCGCQKSCGIDIESRTIFSLRKKNRLWRVFPRFSLNTYRVGDLRPKNTCKCAPGHISQFLFRYWKKLHPTSATINICDKSRVTLPPTNIVNSRLQVC